LRVADIYQQQQLDNGTWYLMVRVKDAEPVADNLTVPTGIVSFLSRFHRQYHIDKYEPLIAKALDYTLAGPLKTFNWQNQYEDQTPSKPYHNLSRGEVSSVAKYLLTHAQDNPFYVEMALELIRFIEDQFVVWEQPTDQVTIGALFPKETYYSTHWFTPCVCEQYNFWQPVNASATQLISLYQKAYEVTADNLFLQKALALANTITICQANHNGEYPTYLIRVKRDYWTNCTIATARAMINFDEFLKK